MVGLGSCSSHIEKVGLEVVLQYDGQFSLVLPRKCRVTSFSTLDK